MHSYYADGDIDGWVEQLPGDARVVFQVKAENRDDAIRKLSALRKADLGKGGTGVIVPG